MYLFKYLPFYCTDIARIDAIPYWITVTIVGDLVHLSQMSYDQNERCRGSPTSRQRYRLFYLLDVLLIVRSEETDLTALLVHSPDNSKPLFGKLCWLLLYIILEHPCVQIFNHLESTCEIQETALRSSHD